MEDNIFDKVHEVDLEKTMKDSYIDYAMSVIASRALPDVRDGLKPVQRRVSTCTFIFTDVSSSSLFSPSRSSNCPLTVKL